MSDHKWSSKTLQEMAEDVAYEMRQLSDTAHLLMSGRFPTGARATDEQRALGRALLESALVHARSLDDFLGLAKRPMPDDVIALDYLPSWKPKRPLSGAERAKVNKLLAHLSTERRKGTGRYGWPLKRFEDVFFEAVAFLKALEQADPLKAAWFQKYIDWSGVT